jgi:hypothetical protein
VFPLGAYFLAKIKWLVKEHDKKELDRIKQQLKAITKGL